VESHDSSAVPLFVTIIDGTDCGGTEVPIVVQASALGTSTSAAATTAKRRTA